MRGLDYNTLNTPLTVGTNTVTINTSVPGVGNSAQNANYARDANSEFVLQVSFTNGGIGADFDAAGVSPISGEPLAQQNITAGMYT